MEVNIQEDKIFIMSSWKFKKTYEKAFYATAKELHLMQGEIDVLLFLHNNQPLDTARDIAEYRSLSKSMVSKCVDSLINKGYLISQANFKDKRSNRLVLATDAHPVVERLLVVQKEFLKILFTDITADEYEVMKRIFNKMNQNVEAKHSQEGKIESSQAK